MGIKKSRATRLKGKSRIKSSSRNAVISYTKKKEFIRKFQPVRAGPLTPQKKSAITRLYNKFWLARFLQFKPADKGTIKRARKAGIPTSRRGVFIEKKKRQRAKALKGRIVQSAARRHDEYYYFKSPIEKAAFASDPEAVTRRIAGELVADEKKLRRGSWKWTVRIIYKNGNETDEQKLDSLTFYAVLMAEDVPNTRRGGISITAQQKRERYAKQISGLHFVFYKSQLQTANAVNPY